jgi:hypothetical protein
MGLRNRVFYKNTPFLLADSVKNPVSMSESDSLPLCPLCSLRLNHSDTRREDKLSL